jgi:hypothetical protein
MSVNEDSSHPNFLRTAQSVVSGDSVFISQTCPGGSLGGAPQHPSNWLLSVCDQRGFPIAASPRVGRWVEAFAADVAGGVNLPVRENGRFTFISLMAD